MSTIDDPTGNHIGGLGANRDHGGGGGGDEEYDSDYGDDDFDDEPGTAHANRFFRHFLRPLFSFMVVWTPYRNP